PRPSGACRPCRARRTRRAGRQRRVPLRSVRAIPRRSRLRPPRTPRLLSPTDEARDAIARFLDLLERRRVARADVPRAALAEGAARDDDHLLLGDEPLAELAVGQAGARNVREAVESAARLEAVQPQLVEAAQHHLPPLVVRGDHAADLLFAAPQRL